MASKKQPEPFQISDALLRAYSTNNRINKYMLENLAEEAWMLKAPGGRGRDAASIVAHMHNVRLMWLKAVGIAEAEIPGKLDGATATKNEAIQALDASCRAMEVVVRNALEGSGHVKGFQPDVCSFFAYLVAHDAHHRGQISMLARQNGYALPQSVNFGMWEWGTR